MATNEDILLVPSAVLVPDELKFDLGPIATAMIPFDGKPAIEHIAAEYEEHDMDLYVAGDEQIEKLASMLDRLDREWTLLDVSGTTSLGETVADSLSQIADRRSLDDADLYINFADTIVSPVGYGVDASTVSCSEVSHAYRWTSFSKTDDGEIDSITEKFSRVFDSPRNVFTGQFKLTAPADYWTLLKAACGGDDGKLDPFYVALQSYLSNQPSQLLEADRWVDIGHLDTYYQNKRDSLNVREFNSIDVATNTITKSSEDSDTLRNEISWFKKLPKQLRPYIPQIYDYSDSYVDPSITMEYIGYPTLSDIYIYGSHGLHLWSNIYSSLFTLLERFQEFQLETDPAEITETLEEMYYEKTVNRLRRAEGMAGLDPFFEPGEITVNGETYPTVPAILDILRDTLTESCLLERDRLSVIHGDLCFPNVLFDVRNNIPKLIDPRGAFGPHTIYGDYRYDLAKLRHSVSGHYEFIINDLFDVSVSEEQVSFETHTDPVHDRREELFDDQLAQEYPEDVQDVKLLESLLYLSMVPLHSDSTQRQQCMLATGIEKFAAARGDL
ncbi:aminoglycoside phosphotransferase family protein [Haloarcula salinisoli]|uniref:Aminoglycoside phosphotransferase family protein n=1 Tax=Haloarcula salinisoli TaxID=2487746 RepID=A0A8J7YCU0_9EURY|nr:aminoglycoside phosphotransferase family protein [Halomicroarcula salinisoli]MBX0303037.1 aminoglycoside phosphotransferase family protein [Halomicroarcula salinisoli]